MTSTYRQPHHAYDLETPWTLASEDQVNIGHEVAMGEQRRSLGGTAINANVNSTDTSTGAIQSRG